MGTVKGTSRRQKAQATRQRIVETAHAAFLEDGYAASTMADIAADAGVAVQTVYFAFRTKGELLQAVYEHVVLGPERKPPQQSGWWRAIEEARSIEIAVRAFVTGTVELLERAAPLVRLVLGDETARDGYDFNERLRRDGYEALLVTLTAKHELRPDITPARARDLLLVLTGPLLYSQFTADLKWTRDEVDEWM